MVKRKAPVPCCSHVTQVGKVGLGVDIYRKKVGCAECKLLAWQRTWQVYVERERA
jgi:hypothetical protein